MSLSQTTSFEPLRVFLRRAVRPERVHEEREEIVEK